MPKHVQCEVPNCPYPATTRSGNARGVGWLCAYHLRERANAFATRLGW